jgi:hypothetical protein
MRLCGTGRNCFFERKLKYARTTLICITGYLSHLVKLAFDHYVIPLLEKKVFIRSAFYMVGIFNAAGLSAS